MLKRKQAKKIAKHFDKLIEELHKANKGNGILLSQARAESFVKALELAEVIDRFTSEEMRETIIETEQNAYKKMLP